MKVEPILFAIFCTQYQVIYRLAYPPPAKINNASQTFHFLRVPPPVGSGRQRTRDIKQRQHVTGLPRADTAVRCTVDCVRQHLALEAHVVRNHGSGKMVVHPLAGLQHHINL